MGGVLFPGIGVLPHVRPVLLDQGRLRIGRIGTDRQQTASRGHALLMIVFDEEDEFIGNVVDLEDGNACRHVVSGVVNVFVGVRHGTRP